MIIDIWIPIGVHFHLSAERFYKLNPKKLERYLPYLKEESNGFIGDIHLAGWIYGQYIASSIGSNFSKRSKYPSQPYYINDHHEDADDEEVYVMTDAERFEAFATVFNANMAREKADHVVDGEYVEVAPVLSESGNDSDFGIAAKAKEHNDA